MTKRGDQQKPTAGSGTSTNNPKREIAASPQPAWAKGLQRLYDQVVEEQLPDDLAQLLDKLDRASDGH
ncbi:MAG: NepR family anti-sigma factor [Novosphingobium sp.]